MFSFDLSTMPLFYGITKAWEVHAIFTLGKFTKFTKPGLYWLIPFFQRPLFIIDTRIITYSIPLQRGLTKDNIPVDVDGIVFYQVSDVHDAILNVDDYHSATRLTCRAAIRDMVGQSTLDELLSERDKIGIRLSKNISEFTERWGINVISVEIKDVIVSKELEDAIAREPAAEREKRARILLADAERLAVDSILKAADKYKENATALALRSMNMLYEIAMEGKSTMVFVPTENSGGALPGVIGLKKIDELIHQKDKKQD